MPTHKKDDLCFSRRQQFASCKSVKHSWLTGQHTSRILKCAQTDVNFNKDQRKKSVFSAEIKFNLDGLNKMSFY